MSDPPETPSPASTPLPKKRLSVDRWPVPPPALERQGSNVYYMNYSEGGASIRSPRMSEPNPNSPELNEPLPIPQSTMKIAQASPVPLAFLVGGGLVTIVFAVVAPICGNLPPHLGGSLSLVGGLLVAFFANAISIRAQRDA
jgi:hypothetical protein